MALGPGKYDDLCTYVREESNAEAAIIIVVNGEKGTGFSCQCHGTIISPLALATTLEQMAKQIKDLIQ